MTTPKAAPGPRRQGPDVGVVVEAMRALLDPAAVTRLHERLDRIGWVPTFRRKDGRPEHLRGAYRSWWPTGAASTSWRSRTD